MNLDECYYLGYTSKVHGKQGELIIKLDVDFPEEYKDLESVLIQMNKKDKSLIPFFISNSQIQNNGNLKIKLEDNNSVDEAKALIGKEVYLPLNTLPKLAGNQFYFHEVIGFTIIDATKGEVGTIKQVLEYPTQSIFEVINADGKEILIPIAENIIAKVDRTNKTIEVNTPDGLIDLYLE
jgi:16S rRNA processing protein RimM